MNHEKLNCLATRDIRFEMFKKAIHFVEYEVIQGDIVEFGVYTGRSLALLDYAYRLEINTSIHRTTFDRNIKGFDSFEGIYGSDHPRWHDGIFKYNHSYHPFLQNGERVTEEEVYSLFDYYSLSKPKIYNGYFDVLEISSNIKKAAIIHIDCDTASATNKALEGCADALQDGTIVMFDDWFNNRGNPDKGECLGLYQFLHSYGLKFTFIPYFDYGTFCKSFIVRKT
jgi:hypothetical protein